MAILSDYTAGTVSVSTAGTAVTGVGTAWLTAGFREGDLFIAAEWYSVIASVNSNTSLTLYPVGRRGGALSGAPYRLRYMSDGSRTSAQARQLINMLGSSGNLEALGGLTGAANTGMFFTGAGTMNTFPLTALGRELGGLTGANGSFIRSTGANTAVMQAIVGTVAQSGGVPTGALVERGSNSNGHYARFAGGLQVCLQEITHDLTSSSAAAYSFPAAFNPTNRIVPFWGPSSGFAGGDITALGNGINDVTSGGWRFRVAGGGGVSTAAVINLGAVGFWHT